MQNYLCNSFVVSLQRITDEICENKQFSSVRKIKDTYPKYLLTTDFDNANIDGIRKINVIDWVLGSRL